jgi:hypothetical protein
MTTATAPDIQVLLNRAQARGRIASTLEGVLRDVFDAGELDPGCMDTATLDGILAGALDAATDAALATFAARVEPAFTTCSRANLERLAFGRRSRELGWD